MFGMPYHTRPEAPTLEGSGLVRLSDGESAAADLRKLVRSALVQYMELVQGVVQGEVGRTEERLAALETMLLNMHFIVNSYRPRQALDTTAALVRLEIDRQKKLTREIHDACDEAEALLDRQPPAKKQK